MKRFISILVAGLVWMGASPAAAQTGSDHDMRFDLTYTPLRVSTSNPSGVVNSDMSAITVSGEGRVFRGLMLGGSYTWGGGTDLTVTGVVNNQNLQDFRFNDTEYGDFRLYAKIPFNWESFADADRTMGPKPAFSPFYGYVGYKNTQLSADTSSLMGGNVPLGRLNVESSSGIGFGLGADVQWDPVSVYGQFVYYPTMFTKSVGVSNGGNPEGYLRVYEWDLGLRTNLGDSPVQAKVGYHFESHQAQNVQLRYDGFQFGATAAF